MELVKQSKHLEFIWKDVTFFIRPIATAGDKHEMTMRFSDGVEKDGTYKASKSDVYPWIIERFVTGWQGVTNGARHEVPWSIAAYRDLPADPEQDLTLILGSYIVN